MPPVLALAFGLIGGAVLLRVVLMGNIDMLPILRGIEAA